LPPQAGIRITPGELFGAQAAVSYMRRLLRFCIQRLKPLLEKPFV
jgi:hypothetical protein